MVKLTGAFIELHKVDDWEGTETETKIGETLDDVEIDGSPETAETKPHGSGRRDAKGIGDAPELSFNGLIVSTLDAWDTIGWVDSNNEVPRHHTRLGGTSPALRLKVFADEGDTTPTQEWAFEDPLFLLNNWSFPQEDFATWEATAVLEGRIVKESDTG